MPILECQKVSKAYGGLLAVSDLSFAVEPGEVYAIVGPNGAGKTSLFDCISGVNPATGGVIKFKGREIQRLRAHQISRLGLARTFQTTLALDRQTVLTNVLIGGTFGRDGQHPTLWFEHRAQDDALDALALCGLAGDQRTLAGQLPVLARKRLMLAHAPAHAPADAPARGAVRRSQPCRARADDRPDPAGCQDRRDDPDDRARDEGRPGAGRPHPRHPSWAPDHDRSSLQSASRPPGDRGVSRQPGADGPGGGARRCLRSKVWSPVMEAARCCTGSTLQSMKASASSSWVKTATARPRCFVPSPAC